MMQFKGPISNIVYAIILFAVIFVIIYVDLLFKVQQNMDAYIIGRPIFISLSYPMIGALFGLPSLWKQFSIQEPWRVNTSRLLCLAVPSFIIANFSLFSILFWETMGPILLNMMPILMMVETVTYIFQILFGFVLITSFYKGKKRVKSVEIDKSLIEKV